MASPGDSLLRLVELAVGALGGALVTLVAFRTKFAMLTRDIREEAAARGRLAESIDSRLERVEKRQLLALRITADIARKVNVDERLFDDALVRMLSEE